VLSASLVHELRQPLFAARAMAQLAQAASRPDQVAGHLDGVLAQLGTLDLLLRAYSELSRSPLTEALTFDVWQAVDSALVVVGTAARRGGVVVRLLGERGVLVTAPALAVQQVLVNLLQNAIEALSATTPAELTLTVLAGPARVRVVDNGPGVAPEIRGRLFEPFRTTKPTGTGLGLVLSRDLARGFGGDLVLLESEPGRTAWELCLPA
jgi:two-component system C4-dicarboxylate transport sensor histidine kinase DctB